MAENDLTSARTLRTLSTGGHPPAARYAPLKPLVRARIPHALVRDTTGGRLPAACYAPLKSAAGRGRALRERERERERALRELAYAHCASTGRRPPEDCFAPAKPARHAARRPPAGPASPTKLRGM